MSQSRDKVYLALAQAVRRQEIRWGKQDHDDAFWFMIVMEELGEAAQACKRGVHEGDHSMKSELTSVAAMIQQWLERIEERKVPDREGA